jgi:hypothetical protein
MKKLIKSFSAIAPARSQDTVAAVDTENYTTCVVVGVERRSEVENPLSWHIGLEEVETVVPAQHHIVEWPLFSVGHESP